ncbi:MAG: Holliday junction branch migration protein RuvA [Gemmatimonadetes bacterium]|nr:Holliday junction branch migration protein RuvA [Gemmatimonadota bacterium]MBT8404416.1 Holliday junction branch migration protein RuvA [Gemmatimonadota bacterium]NNF38524.1 Holliday junction branch migration protein RuvA [Gemmatimonadota bacterium]NNK61685.1 Holliday junction branch migration protein RuvA [Gemmatimonadota bacterium]
MISRLKGSLLTRDTDRVEVDTAGGVVYEVEIPLTVARRLPALGVGVELRTLQVVREDSTTLYGFLEPTERELFKRLLGARGVGAKLALAMLSTYDAPRLARALAEKDVPALQQVSGVGRKTAERIVLDLADKVTDLAVGGGPSTSTPGAGAQAAVAALVALGYSFGDADTAVRAVLSAGDVESTDELIRRALQSG